MERANRKRRRDARESCPSCGGSRHMHTSALAEDFRCYWTQFSHQQYGLEPGDLVPFRKAKVIEFANWVQDTARPRPRRGPDGKDIPPGPDERVKFFE